jgi:DNA-directed RNA polymerase subunit RPC12/RpoP
MIRFACPGCQATFSVPDAQAGQPGACDKCGVRFLIPAPLTAPVEAPPPLPSEAEEPPPPPSTRPASQPEVRSCPTCETKVTILPEDIGHEVECPACKAIFKITGTSIKPRPSSRRRRDEDDNDYSGDPRSRRRSRRNQRDEEDDDQQEDDEDARDSKYRRRSRKKYDDDDDYERDERGYIAKPGEVQTIGTLLIVGGVLACLTFLTFIVLGGLSTFGFCCIWPGTWYQLVYGIMAITKGSQLQQDRAFAYPPNSVCIMAIITIINGDVLNMTLGIIGLVMANNPNVKRYFRS